MTHAAAAKALPKRSAVHQRALRVHTWPRPGPARPGPGRLGLMPKSCQSDRRSIEWDPRAALASVPFLDSCRPQKRGGAVPGVTSVPLRCAGLVRSSVRPSVRPSVCPSVLLALPATLARSLHPPNLSPFLPPFLPPFPPPFLPPFLPPSLSGPVPPSLSGPGGWRERVPSVRVVRPGRVTV
jgi:hypothetical protein